MAYDTVEDVLEHYGVKGMKWGVRKDREKTSSSRKQRYEAILNAPSKTIQVTAKNGKTVDVVEDKNSKATALFMSLSKRGVEKNAALRERSPSFKFFVEGKHVGEASFFKGGRNGDDPTELNLVWLGVRKSERGQGYGSAVFDAAVEYGKQTGAKKLTLEVPGNSPDARHIYEKRGFVVTYEPTARQAKADPTWGGLTDMELDLTKLSHSSTERDEEIERALIQSFPQLDEDQEEIVFGELSHMGDVDAVLAHYGVKGMKWGVRKDRSSGSSGPLAKRRAKKAADVAQKKADKAAPKSDDAVRAQTAQRKARNAGTDVLSNQELQALVTRMNLEQQYTRLAGAPQKSAGRQFVENVFDAELKAIKSGKAGPIQTSIEAGKQVSKLLNR